MKFGIIIMILTNRSIEAYAILKKEYVYFLSLRGINNERGKRSKNINRG